MCEYECEFVCVYSSGPSSSGFPLMSLFCGLRVVSSLSKPEAAGMHLFSFPTYLSSSNKRDIRKQTPPNLKLPLLLQSCWEGQLQAGSTLVQT